MTTVKLPKVERIKLIDAINNGGESVTIRVSSRMLVDPDTGINGSVTLPLTKRQKEKLINSNGIHTFKLSKTQIKKLIRGNGFFGSLWSGIKKGTRVVGKVAERVGSKLLDEAVDKAIEMAPALLLGAGGCSCGSASYKAAMGAGGAGGEIGKVGKMPKKNSGLIYISNT